MPMITPFHSDPESSARSRRVTSRPGGWFLLLILAAVACAGCSAGPEPGSAADRAFLVLATRSIEPEPPAVGFFIAGEMRGGAFLPAGEIQGAGEFGSEGHPGWLELADLSFHGDETGRAPFPPFVQGRMGDDSVFWPASRDVSY